MTQLQAGKKVGWLTLQDHPKQSHARLVRVVMPADPAGYAARLYASLHDLDDAGVDRIVVAMPPDHEEWLAIRDRLRRAATS
jgi:L-threonylcarbamoyladenylate synthase